MALPFDPWSLRMPAAHPVCPPCSTWRPRVLSAAWARGDGTRPAARAGRAVPPSAARREFPRDPGLRVAAQVSADAVAEPAGLLAVERGACDGAGEQRAQRERGSAHAG